MRECPRKRKEKKKKRIRERGKNTIAGTKSGFLSVLRLRHTGDGDERLLVTYTVMVKCVEWCV